MKSKILTISLILVCLVGCLMARQFHLINYNFLKKDAPKEAFGKKEIDSMIQCAARIQKYQTLSAAIAPPLAIIKLATNTTVNLEMPISYMVSLLLIAMLLIDLWFYTPMIVFLKNRCLFQFARV